MKDFYNLKTTGVTDMKDFQNLKTGSEETEREQAGSKIKLDKWEDELTVEDDRMHSSPLYWSLQSCNQDPDTAISLNGKIKLRSYNHF